MKFALALAIATSFWSHHGVRTPCHAEAVPTSTDQFAAWGIPGANAAAYPWPAGCSVFLSDAAINNSKYAPEYFCAAVVHEVGNIDGIPENTPAIPVTSGWLSPEMFPPECTGWRAWRRANWGY